MHAEVLCACYRVSGVITRANSLGWLGTHRSFASLLKVFNTLCVAHISTICVLLVACCAALQELGALMLKAGTEPAQVLTNVLLCVLLLLVACCAVLHCRSWVHGCCLHASERGSVHVTVYQG
jgi:cytochrome bd-type quinol oxidase subunit 2